MICPFCKEEIKEGAIKCKHCGSILVSQENISATATPAITIINKKEQSPNVFMHTNYLVRRKIFKIFGASFYIYAPDGRVAFYSKQKAFKLKEDIRVYTGEDMRTEVLTVIARQIIDFSAAYDVFDPVSNCKVGALKRKGMKSLFLKDEWIIMDAQDKEIGLIREDSTFLAIIRRLILSFLIPQKYYGVVNGKEVCLFKQNFNPFVIKINLDYSMDISGLLDRRLGIATAILLCAIEGKQI